MAEVKQTSASVESGGFVDLVDLFDKLRLHCTPEYHLLSLLSRCAHHRFTLAKTCVDMTVETNTKGSPHTTSA